MPPTEQNVLDTFIEHITNIKRHLHNLRMMANEHFGFDADEIDWSHVGTVTHLDQQLEEIVGEIVGELER